MLAKLVMDEVVHIRFQSATLDLEKDVTVNDLIGLIVDHAPTLNEALRAADTLHPLWTAGTFDGTDWGFSFTRKGQVTKLH